MRTRFACVPALAATLALSCIGVPAPAGAGVVNPDISVIGQPVMRWTDDASDPGRKRFRFDAGETEFVFDAALNPYARGTVVAAMADGEAGVEEAYFTMTRGLPLGLAIKAGKYRVGFGRLNPQHPHVYPFAERFRMLADYLPGEEAFNETGLQASEQFALPHDVALTVSADWLQGDSFRRERESSGAVNDPLELGADDGLAEPRAAGLGRVAAFVPLRGQSALEIGVSGAQGVNNAAAGTKTTLIGADAKAKLWNSPTSYLLLQGELVSLDREDAGWDETAAAYTRASVKPSGAYLYGDYNFDTRYDVGASFERWQVADADKQWNQSFGVFAGLALMEETTAFRIGWEHFQAATPIGGEAPDAVHTFTLRVVWSMGPHKAHQF